MAWALSRTDMPFKGLIWISILGTFIIPPYLGAVGWILLAGPERRLAQPRGGRADRRRTGALQHLLDAGAGAGRRLLQLSLRVRAHQVGAGPHLLRDGGRRQHPGRQQPAHDPVDHAAAGAARDPRRLHPGVPGGDRAVRLARAAGVARPLPRGDDPAVAVLRISAQGGRGRRLCDAAADHHHRAVLAAAAHHQPQGLCVPDRQGRRAPRGAAGAVEVAGARLLPVRLHAVLLHAVGGDLPGRVRQGLGPRLLAGQPHLQQRLPHGVRQRH